jgi:hypothetical protein
MVSFFCKTSATAMERSFEVLTNLIFQYYDELIDCTHSTVIKKNPLGFLVAPSARCLVSKFLQVTSERAEKF